MSDLKVYCIRDMKAEAYLQPMYFPNSAVALRGFGEACNDVTTTFYKNAEDYVLFETGRYSEETGLHIPYVTPLRVSSALEASTAHREWYAARSIETQRATA